MDKLAETHRLELSAVPADRPLVTRKPDFYQGAFPVLTAGTEMLSLSLEAANDRAVMLPERVTARLIPGRKSLEIQLVELFAGWQTNRIAESQRLITRPGTRLLRREPAASFPGCDATAPAGFPQLGLRRCPSRAVGGLAHGCGTVPIHRLCAA